MAPRVFAKRHAAPRHADQRDPHPARRHLVRDLNFDAILAVDNFFTAAAAALEFAALVQLRRTPAPEGGRPFRVPLGTVGPRRLLGAAVLLRECCGRAYVTATGSVPRWASAPAGRQSRLLL